MRGGASRSWNPAAVLLDLSPLHNRGLYVLHQQYSVYFKQANKGA